MRREKPLNGEEKLKVHLPFSSTSTIARCPTAITCHPAAHHPPMPTAPQCLCITAICSHAMLDWLPGGRCGYLFHAANHLGKNVTRGISQDEGPGVEGWGAIGERRGSAENERPLWVSCSGELGEKWTLAKGQSQIVPFHQTNGSPVFCAGSHNFMGWNINISCPLKWNMLNIQSLSCC